jgi:hypothetical protein
MGLLQSFYKLAPKDFTENSFREKKARVSGARPGRVISREAARGDDAVNVWVMLQLLIPCVEDAEEANLGAEMFSI